MRVEAMVFGLLLVAALSTTGCSESTDDGGGTGGDMGTGGDGGNVDATCGPWCTVLAECTGESFDECETACVEELSQAESISSECADAVRDQNRCLGDLTCNELAAWFTEVPPVGYPCNAEDDAIEAACL